MTQDQIIQTLHKVIAENSNFTTWTVSTPHLVALVNHAIEAEREACAVIAEEWFCGCGRGRCPEGDMRAQDIADSIRARGQA